MSAKKGAVAAVRKGFAAAMNELETAVARSVAKGGAAAASPAPAAAPGGMLPGLDLGDGEAASLRAKVAELETALSLATRERDAARAALTALRAARAEEARLVEDALKDLRQVS